MDSFLYLIKFTAETGLLAVIIALGTSSFLFYNSRILQKRNEIGTLFKSADEHLAKIQDITEKFWLIDTTLSEFSWIINKHAIQTERHCGELERILNKINIQLKENEPYRTCVSNIYFVTTSDADKIKDKTYPQKMKKILAVTKLKLSLNKKLDNAFHRNFL
jgi:hypothetical protein